MTDAAQSFTAGDRHSRTTGRAPGELGDLAVAFDDMADAVVRSERDRRTMTADVARNCARRWPRCWPRCRPGWRNCATDWCGSHARASPA
ncbi:hypothetical protein E3O65_02105 [Cryobacterium breve]|uniref:HAMP domain-containing protein n=1 Tax=Cryobacterium breve TaxID=1259258 RepID=A0ABY2J826_9MICO|nr:hypothetical protein E3T20_14310 [Cryobacterium sp. TmT3-12]TFD01109.1 hypothetical protein E3O65_02105 [Cryobacterium breve]